MINVEQADNYISDNIKLVKGKLVKLKDSLGKVLAIDIYAKRDLPPFNRVAMDGIAISTDAINIIPNITTPSESTFFTIEDIQAAGEPQKELKQTTKSCLEAMTGAILPTNCNIVIPYEMLTIDYSSNDKKAIFNGDISKLKSFQNIHKKGSDLSKGDLILKKGTLINATIIGILASEGISQVSVEYSPKIAIISTGSELIELNEIPLSHQIHISNNYALSAELSSFGFNNISQFHIADNKELLYSRLKDIVSTNDIVLLTGGVSKGKFDYVPDILARLNINKVFHKVSQRPGKPLWFGVHGNNDNKEKKVVVFGLPGNPVSALINLRRHIIPHLTSEINSITKVKISQSFSFRKQLTCFLPVKIELVNGELLVTPTQTNGSGDYQTLKNSTGFIELDKGKQEFNKNELVNYYSWGKLCL